MANDDIQPAAVEETPTSYNAKGQMAMMVAIGVLLIILIVYSVTNSKQERNNKQAIESTRQGNSASASLVPPSDLINR